MTVSGERELLYLEGSRHFHTWCSITETCPDSLLPTPSRQQRLLRQWQRRHPDEPVPPPRRAVYAGRHGFVVDVGSPLGSSSSLLRILPASDVAVSSSSSSSPPLLVSLSPPVASTSRDETVSASSSAPSRRSSSCSRGALAFRGKRVLDTVEESLCKRSSSGGLKAEKDLISWEEVPVLPVPLVPALAGACARGVDIPTFRLTESVPDAVPVVSGTGDVPSMAVMRHMNYQFLRLGVCGLERPEEEVFAEVRRLMAISESTFAALRPYMRVVYDLFKQQRKEWFGSDLDMDPQPLGDVLAAPSDLA